MTLLSTSLPGTERKTNKGELRWAIGLAFRSAAIPFDTEASKHKLMVAPLEDIIGLKLQAHFNSKDRKTDDIKDIENIVKQHKSKLNYEKIKEYASLFNAQDLLNKIWNVK